MKTLYPDRNLVLPCEPLLYQPFSYHPWQVKGKTQYLVRSGWALLTYLPLRESRCSPRPRFIGGWAVRNAPLPGVAVKVQRIVVMKFVAGESPPRYYWGTTPRRVLGWDA